MKLIAGLGNPGKNYENTRHNLGFMVLDDFARTKGLSWKYSQDFMGYFIKKEEFILLKPQTFMNKSGESIRNVSSYFRVKNDDILVVHDEMDLEFLRIKLAFDGLSAGHNGIDSVISALGVVDFNRLRIGIGKPKDQIDGAKYVLMEFGDDEKKELSKLIKRCEAAIDAYLIEGLQATMNRFN